MLLPKMYWFLKVTFIVIYFDVQINSLPYRSPSQQLKTNSEIDVPLYKHDSNYKSPTDVLIHPKLQHRDLSLNGLSNRLRRMYSDFSKGKIPTPNERPEVKRGINVGIHLNLPTTKKYDVNLEKLEDILAKALAERLTEERYNNTDCPSCEEDEEEIPVKRIVKPAYTCDEWNSKHRICILERNIGDTVTFYLSTGKHGSSRHPNVTWKKEFHMRNSAETKEFVIEPDHPPENIIVGRKGYELRVSPITETDVEYNMFSATLPSYSSLNKVYFMIRIVPIDLGFIYVGETIELNLRSYVSLPIKSMTFKWYMEKDGEHGTLPSNMKVSFTGSSIKISELRQEQEGILACSVYTNLDFLATKKRFLLKDLTKNNDVLQSSPNHTLIFKEVTIREKRDPKKVGEYSKFSIKLSRHKHKRNLADEIDRDLLWSMTTEKQITPSHSYDYNLEMDRSHDQDSEESQIPIDYQNKFPEISESEDDVDESSKPKQIDISIGSGPEEDETTVEIESTTYNPQELPPQTEVPIDELIAPTQYQPDGIFNKPNNHEEIAIQEDTHQKSQLIPKFQKQHPLPPFIHQNKIKQKVNGKKPHQNINKYLDIQTKTHKPNQKDGYSEIIWNINKVSKSHKITAEDRISKLISSCSNDFECSENAVCITPSLQNSGFCKCLHGSIGVGIFCREEIWLSDSKFDIEELHNPEYT